MRHHRDDHVNHHDHDAIVELVRIPNRVEADVLVAKLQANGITASVRYGGLGTMVPYPSLADGNTVLVFDCDLERATAVMNEVVADDA